MHLQELISRLDDAAVAISHSESFPIRGSNVPQCPRATFALLDGADKLPISGVRARTLQVGKENHEHLQRALVLAFGGGTVEHEAFLERTLTASPDALERIRDACVDAGSKAEIRNVTPAGPGLDTFTLRVPLHADFSFFNAESRVLTVIEIKTIKDFGFRKRKSEGVDTAHAVQLIAQAKAISEEIHDASPTPVLSRQTPITLNLCVLYENKNTCELHLEPVNADSVHWREQYAQHVVRFDNAIVGWATDNPHAAPPIFAEQADNKGALPWQCNYCSVGPIAGKCSKQPLVNRAKPDDIPKWFIDFNAVAESDERPPIDSEDASS